MSAALDSFDPLTGQQLPSITLGTIETPTLAATPSLSGSQEVRVRNTGDAVAVGNIQVRGTFAAAISSPILSVKVTASEASFANITGTVVSVLSRTPTKSPLFGAYQIVCIQTSPTVQVTVARNGGAPSPAIAISVGVAEVDTVIAGLTFTFSGSIAENDVATVGVIQPTTYELTFRDNASQLEAQINTGGYEAIAADGVTPNVFSTLPGVEFVFAASLTTANAGVSRASLRLYEGGRFVEISDDDTAFVEELTLAPPNGALLPYFTPKLPSATPVASAGTLAAATYDYAIVAKRGASTTALDPTKIATVTAAVNDAIDIEIDGVAGGFDPNYEIYRRTGAGSWELLATHDFVSTSIYRDDGTVVPSGVAPAIGQELTTYVRYAYDFPEVPKSDDFARLLFAGSSL